MSAAPGSRYYYPDIVVSCNDPADEPDPYTETRPSLIVEVLSPSTESTDRREKRVVCQNMESLGDYVLVNLAEREIEVYSRDADGWTHRRVAGHETLALGSIGVELPAADVFEGVEPDPSCASAPAPCVRPRLSAAADARTFPRRAAFLPCGRRSTDETPP